MMVKVLVDSGDCALTVAEALRKAGVAGILGYSLVGRACSVLDALVDVGLVDRGGPYFCWLGGGGQEVAGRDELDYGVLSTLSWRRVGSGRWVAEGSVGGSIDCTSDGVFFEGTDVGLSEQDHARLLDDLRTALRVEVLATIARWSKE